MKRAVVIGSFMLAAILQAEDLQVMASQNYDWEDGKVLNNFQIGENQDVTIQGSAKQGVIAEAFQMGKGSNLHLKYETDEMESNALRIYFKKQHEGLSLVGEGGSLSIESYAKGNLDSFRSPYGYGYGFGWLEDRDISRGLLLSADNYDVDNNQHLTVAGDLKIKSSGFGLDMFTNWYDGDGKAEKPTHNKKRSWDAVKTIDFLANSKTEIAGTYTGVFMGTHGDSLNFLEGSEAKISGGNFGINVNSASHSGRGNLYLQKGSKLQVEGNIALQLRKGNLFLDPDVADEEVPELKVYGKKKALANVKFASKTGKGRGKLKLEAVGHDAFEYASGDLQLVKGSKVDGNIWHSSNFHLRMDPGTKYYADELLSLKEFDLKGDLYVGTEEAYALDGHAGASHMTAKVAALGKERVEKIIEVAGMSEEDLAKSQDASLKRAKEDLEELDGISGASYILMPGMKKASKETAKEVEYIHFGLSLGENAEKEAYLKEVENKVWNWKMPLAEGKKILKEEFGLSDAFLADVKSRDDFYEVRKAPMVMHQHDPEEYYALEVNDGNFRFDNAKIHLRIGGEHPLSETDGKMTNHDTLKVGGKGSFQLQGKLVLHPRDEKELRRSDVFENVLELPKYQVVTVEKGTEEMAPISSYDIEIPETEIGPYVLEGKKIQHEVPLLQRYKYARFDSSKREDRDRLAIMYEKAKMEHLFKSMPIFEESSLVFLNPPEYQKKYSSINHMKNGKYVHIGVKEGTDLQGKTETEYIDSVLTKIRNTPALKQEYADIMYRGKGLPAWREEYTAFVNASEEQQALQVHNQEVEEKLKEWIDANLAFTNRLSRAAKKEFAKSYDKEKMMQSSLGSLATAIHEFRNRGELSENAWLKDSAAKYKNKVSGESFETNLLLAGYDHKISKNTALGFYLGQHRGEYKGQSYGLYLNGKYASLFLNQSIFREEKSFREFDLGLAVSKIYQYGNLSFEPMLKTVYRRNTDMDYVAKEGFSVKIEGEDSLYTEGSLRLGYSHPIFEPYLKYSLAKDYGRRNAVVFNGDLSKRAKGDESIQEISTGLEYPFGNGDIHLEVKKEFSSKYKNHMNVSVGMKYSF